jgi:hypothetical protein
MNTDLLRRVRQLRQGPHNQMGIVSAVQLARYEQRPPASAYEFLTAIEDGPCRVFGELGELDIVVTIESDDDFQLGEDDVSGTFTDTASDTTVLNTRRDWASDYKYYEPSNYRIAQTRADFKGMSKSVADEAKRAAIESDMADDATRHAYGLTVTVLLNGRELGSQSLWGIDSIDGYDARPYLIDTAEELIGEVLHQLDTEASKKVEDARTYADRLAEGEQL